ncbi:MAG: fumarylacetoacetate hydrolase family protein [Schleiferiaceae bacterium]|nr:fumarylacetoacetate hydrolase family protein [Schleiferiaceae bacterium]
MKIICIGRNYTEHAAELNNPVPKEPVVFLKPETAIKLPKLPFFLPDFSEDVHYELEVVVRINRLGKNIQEQFAHKYYEELSVGIDFTARDLQNELKQKGLPWEKAKGFDSSAVVGHFIAKSKFNSVQDIPFSLEKNGTTVQQGNTKDMLFGIDQIISHISKYFTLKIGDLIYTGTPSGVGKVVAGDVLSGYLDGVKSFEFAVK